LNEIMIGPTQWVELYNSSSAPVSLVGWTLEAEGPGSPTTTLRYRIPAGISIAANGYLVLYGGQTGIILQVGSRLSLLAADGNVVDSVVIGQVVPGDSYSRDAAGAWHGDWPPTAGQPNRPNLQRLRSMPAE
jgi:hypothetical protein